MYKKMWTKRCRLFLRTPQTISIYKTYEGKAERSTCVLQLLQNTTNMIRFETRKKNKKIKRARKLILHAQLCDYNMRVSIISLFFRKELTRSIHWVLAEETLRDNQI